ncbi:hypothetical protein MMC16_003991 [Acarospora aff. strigata]|nr:hypothetical protein [Acarospora aff. strigata]
MIRPTKPAPSLLALPPELHLEISTSLPYPDALSLKHTSRHFYELVDTGVRLKVSWLLDRKTLNLEIPKRKCILKTDEAFCSSREIRGFMEKRRWHQECQGGVCVVVQGQSCAERRRRMQGMRFAVGRGVRILWTDLNAVMLCWLLGLSLAVWGLWMKT